MCIVLVAAPVRSLIIATAKAAAAAVVPASAPAAAAATLAPTSASALPTLYSRSSSWQQAKFTCLSAFFPCVRVCVCVRCNNYTYFSQRRTLFHGKIFLPFCAFFLCITHKTKRKQTQQNKRWLRQRQPAPKTTIESTLHKFPNSSNRQQQFG